MVTVYAVIFKKEDAVTDVLKITQCVVQFDFAIVGKDVKFQDLVVIKDQDGIIDVSDLNGTNGAVDWKRIPGRAFAD